MYNDIGCIAFANYLDKPFLFLDKNGFVVAKNDFYVSLGRKIKDFDEMEGSIFDSLIISSDQKDRLKRGEKVAADFILSMRTGTLSKVFPTKRLINNLFLNIVFIPMMTKGEIAGYVVIITDNTDKFNDGIDIRERTLMWKNISLLGKMIYIQYDIHADEWLFSDNSDKILNAEGHSSNSKTVDRFLEGLSAKDRKMIQEQWGLSLVDSRPGDVFEYTFEADVNGEKRFQSARWTVDNNESNPVAYGVIMDVTELMKTELALSDSIAQMSLLSSIENLVLWNYDVVKEEFIINKEISNDDMVDDIGLIGNKLRKEDILSIVHPDDLSELRNGYESVVSGKNSLIKLETRVKNQNDNYIFVSTNCVVQKIDVSDKPILIMGLSKLQSDGNETLRSKKMEEKQTILIAEDIDNNYDLLNIILRKDYKLVRAVNGVEAVRLFSEIKPDIILMDMKMPEMGGLEATRLIRMESQDVPVIAVTAFAFESDREVAIEAGCNDFLSKPVDIPVLKSLIKKYLAN